LFGIKAARIFTNMMKSLEFYRRGLHAVVALLLVALPFPTSLFSAGSMFPVKAPDERGIEDAREEAILDAFVSVDPSIDKAALSDDFEGEVSANDKISIAVEQLRHERKAQFRHLTWSHIKSMINADVMLAKQEFLRDREKNLMTVLERAIEVYLPAQIERERIQLAKFKIAKAIRDLFPEASLAANIKNGTLSSDSFESDNWRMTLRQPVFRGGVLWNTLFLEWANMDIAKRSYDQSISDLIRDVSEAYFEYERSINVLKEQRELFTKVETQKKMSDQKAAIQIISEIEQLNTDSLYSQAQYDLENAEQEREIAALELTKYLQLDPASKLNLEPLYQLDQFDVRVIGLSSVIPGISDANEVDDRLGQLIDLAYQNRPDLEVEASKLKASQLAYRIALGRRLPQFDFLVEFGELAEAFVADLPSKNPPNHQHEFRVGMELTMPLAGNTLKYTYDHDQRSPSVTQFLSGAGSRTRSNQFTVDLLDDIGQFSSMTEAKIENLEQVVELEKTEREVVREVKEAFFNFNKSRIQVESAHKRMGYRKRLALLAFHRLGKNEIQISEYLQAEMDLVEERNLFFKAVSDFFLSKAELNRAIGVRSYLSVDALS
jgi:outer membrane protein TolC